jgi:hypothetical protein
VEEPSGGASIVGTRKVSTTAPDIYCKMQADMLVTARLSAPAGSGDEQHLNLGKQAAEHLAAQHPPLGSINEKMTAEAAAVYLWEYGSTRNRDDGSMVWSCKICKDGGSKFTTFCTV